MNDTVHKAIDDQIQMELTSAYHYLAASAYFEAATQSGFASWMRKQAQEELAHALRFFDYLADRGVRVTLKAIPAPEASFASALAVFQSALRHEQAVTKAIHNLYDLAVREKDLPTQSMLAWFIDEQVEEEKNATTMVERLTMAGDDRAALLMLDREAASRSGE